MSNFSRLRRWKSTPANLRNLLLEAAWELLCARLTVGLGLRRALPGLLVPRNSDGPLPPAEIEADIRRSIRIAAVHVPWTSLCLPNAIAAKRMLRRRGFSSTIHLGVGNLATGDLHAHAWLEAGGRIIIGEDGMSGVSPLPSAFSGTRSGFEAK